MCICKIFIISRLQYYNLFIIYLHPFITMTLTTNEYEVRIAKRQQLIDMGIMPYASRRDKDQTV